MPELTAEQIQQMVAELDQSSFLIVNDEDRNFVQWAKMMIEMMEPISVEGNNRIYKIWLGFKKFQHDSIG